MKLIICLFLVAAISSCSFFHHKSDKRNSDIAAIIPLHGDNNGVYAQEARYSNWPNPDTMIIYVDGSRLRIAPMGNVISPEGKVLFSIENEYPIEQLFFAQRGRDLFIFYTDIDERGCGSYIKRFSLESNKMIWSSEIDGYSFSKPLIRGQFAYVGTIGFIGKIKLKNGQFDWKFSNIIRNGRFNNFSNIDFVEPQRVRFVATHPFMLKSDTIIVNDITGEIICMN